jgi:aspartate racemase
MSPKSAREQVSLNKRIAGLSPERRAVLERLLRKQQHSDTGVTSRDRSLDPPPLTFAQEQLWFLDQLAPGNWFYNESSALHLNYAVNPAVLQKALNETARRHEALRTTFITVRGELVQAIASEFTVPMVKVDLSGLTPEEGKSEARRIAAEDAQSPFDLALGPLIRTTLLSLGEQEFIFLLTMHHIIFDGWSFTILLRELSEIYEAFAAGRPSPLPELPVQYGDFAVWQRRWLRGDALEAKLSYWRQQLADLPLLQLPTDYPRPAFQSFEGARCTLEIPRSLCDAIRALGATEGMTPFMTLLTAFKALLYRYAGQDEIVVGVPIANRDRVEIEGLIGFFVNTLVMRTDFSGDPTFREALARVRKVTLEAFEHQDVPFEKLVEQLQPERDLSRNPLFQITFQLYSSNTGNGSSQNGTVSFDQAPSPFEVEAGTAKFDLRFDLAETADGGLTGFLEYDTALFAAESISRMVRHFQILLESAVTSPGLHLSELSLLTPAERHELIVERNATATGYPRDACIHELFEQRVERTPQAIAVECESQTLTYAEMDRRSTRLAHYLRNLGVGLQTPVGISTERSLEMIVGLLGILKAGGVYVPLDLEDPRERLLFSVENAGVRIVLTRERQLYYLSDRGIRVIPLAVESADIDREPDSHISLSADSYRLAYILFTSGSTGKPKGVCVPHRAVVRLVANTNFFRTDEQDVFLQFAPLGFDASTFEIWGALLNGAPLVVFPPYVPSMEELSETIQRKRVTTLWLTAALFHQMVDSHLGSLAGVRHLLAGGDVLSVPHIRKFLDRYPQATLTNGYGPTENTTFTCTYSTSDASSLGASCPIGKPIANTRVYVLDRHRQLVPSGLPGELYAAGDGLARGYLKSPELTTQKFVSDPFSPDQGAKMYATGDRVRYLPDGNLDFLGRTDNQVKVRGYRIELDEIASVLRCHPAVRDAVCIVREDIPGDKRIAAYVVLDAAAGNGADLRAFLEEHLPDYAIPSAIVSLEAFPVTRNGKVDRAALPAPGSGRPEIGATYVAPQTDSERLITALWQEVLGIQNPGIHDNFFDLGGHSLLVVLLHNRLREAFRKNISIVDLFRYPTIAALAKLLNPEEARSAGQ